MTETPKTQEEKIIFILLNYIAIEGAYKLFSTPFPKDMTETATLLEKIDGENFPEKFNDKSYQKNKLADFFSSEWGKSLEKELDKSSEISDIYKCWLALTRIRNNICHANKAYHQDLAVRIDLLLDWSVDFINHLLSATDSAGAKHSFVVRAEEIKQKLKIDNW
jgi:hypothetical protein